MRISSDGLPFIMPPAVLTVAAAAAGLAAPALVGVLLTGAIAAFFRDPERHSDAAAGSILSPADGRVIHARRDAMGRTHVAIFLSLFNVHVARSPVAGELIECRRRPGGYAAAYRDKASHNARVEMRLRTDSGTVRVALMAGLVARRVLPWVEAPRHLDRGQRIAIIRFGSRAEIELPPGFAPAVETGDRVRAGETVIAMPAEPVED